LGKYDRVQKGRILGEFWRGQGKKEGSMIWVHKINVVGRRARGEGGLPWMDALYIARKEFGAVFKIEGGREEYQKKEKVLQKRLQ